MHSQVRIFITRFQDYRRKAGLVRRIGEMLRFEAEAIVLVVDCALAFIGAIQEVSGIELNSRLGGGNFHNSASIWFID